MTLLVLLCMVAAGVGGCETPERTDPLLEEGVTIRELADPQREQTLENLLPDGRAAMAMAVPEGLQTPAIAPGEVYSTTAVLKPDLPLHLRSEDDPAVQAAREAAGDQDLPLDLRSDAEAEAEGPLPEPEDESDDDAAEADPLPRRVIVRRMIFRHPEPRLARALEMVRGSLTEPEQRAWEDSGFVVGQIDQSRLPLFMGNLPRSLHVDNFTMYRVNSYFPITMIDRLRGARRVEVATPTGPVDEHRLIGGKFQMLLKLVPSLDRENQRIYLDLLPHHRGVEAELVPRSPRERVLDGTSFSDLRLYEPLSTKRAWIIAADLPIDQEEDAAEEVDDADEASAEAPGSSAATRRAARPDREPVPLGHAMMQGLQRQQQVQMVLIIIAE